MARSFTMFVWDCMLCHTTKDCDFFPDFKSRIHSTLSIKTSENIWKFQIRLAHSARYNVTLFHSSQCILLLTSKEAFHYIVVHSTLTTAQFSCFPLSWVFSSLFHIFLCKTYKDAHSHTHTKLFYTFSCLLWFHFYYFFSFNQQTTAIETKSIQTRSKSTLVEPKQNNK